ncbi:hypothetical protein AsAng_0038790 [Aureispira anguillae]|uniref:Uncharacterized protein n=1 Tax=Aureispira anguillae TaxID=2864201 RepID=A0A916DVI0_9BACT|nr:hypothetical protein AsAng_0038790 [Aureispira anguillae]
MLLLSISQIKYQLKKSDKKNKKLKNNRQNVTKIISQNAKMSKNDKISLSLVPI